MDCNAVWQWMRLHPWATITGGITLAAAVGGAVIGWLNINKLRRDKRDAERRENTDRIKRLIIAQEKKLRQKGQIKTPFRFTGEAEEKYWLGFLRDEDGGIVLAALVELHGERYEKIKLPFLS